MTSSHQHHPELLDIEKGDEKDTSLEQTPTADEKQLPASAATAPTAAAPPVPPAAGAAPAPAAPAAGGGGGGMPSFPEGGRDAWVSCFGAFWAVFISFGFLNAFGGEWLYTLPLCIPDKFS